MRVAATAVIAVALLGACDDAPREMPPTEDSLVILGVDGMDPVLLQKYMDEGRMPNLKALAAEGTFAPLGTSFPPQSPVAWSEFITGAGVDVHGIYDFIHRDPHELGLYLSTSRSRDPEVAPSIGCTKLPLSSARIELLREGEAFWQRLEKERVRATVVKIPANFPPARTEVNESSSGMGTPDLLGTYGTFQVLTDDPDWVDKKVGGGVVHALDFGGGQRAEAELDGPPNPLSACDEVLGAPVEVIRDDKRPVALIRLGGTEVIVQPGEWTGWVPVSFDPGLLGGEIGGIVRIYVRSLEPHTYIYISPINFDPRSSEAPISSPPEYAERLAADVGRFYTQGMAEDTKALAAGILTENEFLTQADLVWDERVRLLDRELDRYDGGVLFFYFSSIDLLSHMYFRALEPDASPHDARYAHVIPELYERIDGVVGEVRERLGPDITLVVMSDHGFSPYRRKVHLNDWLASQGYLSPREDGTRGEGVLGHIDWQGTQAYGLGFNQLFLNLEGREAQGVVPQAERDMMLTRLERELLRWRDPETGAQVVTRVVRPEVGAFDERAPDLLIGYNRTYRSSDESAQGMITGRPAIEDNEDKWSGDHLMDPAHVPGVVLSNRKLDTEGASLVDMAPTILDYFGIPAPEAMQGRSLWSQ